MLYLGVGILYKLQGLSDVQSKITAAQRSQFDSRPAEQAVNKGKSNPDRSASWILGRIEWMASAESNQPAPRRPHAEVTSDDT